ncbi:MAG: hypothetical protein ABIH48_03055 [Candidatus Falkowbacteria bacterium]
MDNKKIIAISVIVLALIILIGLIYFMFLAPVPEEPVAPAPVVEKQVIEQLPVIEQPVRRAPIEIQATTEDDLKRLSSSFVERYGSYSNQAGYDNIRDLKIFMSRNMQGWADDFINERIQQETDTTIYYGITTKAVVVETQNFDEYATSAKFLVKTQRKESIGDTTNARKFQQNAEVAIVKENGAWKVDKVNWKE